MCFVTPFGTCFMWIHRKGSRRAADLGIQGVSRFYGAPLCKLKHFHRELVCFLVYLKLFRGLDLHLEGKGNEEGVGGRRAGSF
jgi:hypothetical protein